MAGASYTCQFSFDTRRCIRRLGLEKRGRVQRVVSEEILRLCAPYVPFSEGHLQDTGEGENERKKHLKDEGHIENSSVIVWNGPYAHYMYEGTVYEDPKLHCAGFRTENGWYSRKNVIKVPTERRLHYNNGSRRGSHWVERMMQNGGRQKVEAAARRAVEQ